MALIKFVENLDLLINNHLKKSNINVYSLHTNIDFHQEGIHNFQASKLNLKNITFLENNEILKGEFDKEFENEDIEKFSKTQLDILKQTVKSLQLQNETFKKNQCLLIALETIDLRDDITRENIIDIKYTIKEKLITNENDLNQNKAGKIRKNNSKFYFNRN